MALPLEEVVMREIGLGNHYNWYNGSGSCRYIRQKAAEAVTGAIQKHHDAGDEIAPPDDKLIGVMKRIANYGDRSEYSLTNTWIAASYVIAEHIHYANASEEDRRKAFDRLAEYLEKEYLPRDFGMHRMLHFKDK